MKKFLTSNETLYRLLRTIVQGVIGVVISNLDLILGGFSIDPGFKPLIAALVMAVLSPVMSLLGGKDEDNGISET